MTRQNVPLAAAAVAIAVVPLLAVFPDSAGVATFGGTDEEAGRMVAAIRPDYRPWIAPLWEPPSAEMESLLFALQAALGAAALGYGLGYWRGRRQARADDAARH